MNITCVMPTSDKRGPFWPGAVRCFLNQTEQKAKLLVLNDSDAPETPAVFCHPRIKYVQQWCYKMSTGAKRNSTNELAEPGVILHFDDDDWYAPARIERQLKLLHESKKSVVGCHELLYLRTRDRSLWRYVFQGKPPYASGTSLCYWHSYWRSHPFPEKAVGEDSDFALSARASGDLASEPGNDLIVARAHASNTFVPKFGEEPFRRATRAMFPEEFLREEGL